MVTCQRVLYITHQQIQQNYKKYKSNKIITLLWQFAKTSQS